MFAFWYHQQTTTNTFPFHVPYIFSEAELINMIWRITDRDHFRASVSSLGFPLWALYLFTWYHHKMSRWHESLQSAFNSVMLYWSENFIQGWNMYVNAKQPPILVWNQSAGGLEWVVHAKWLQFWITDVFYQHEVYLQITEINEMTHHHVNTIQNLSHPHASGTFIV